MTDLSNLCLLLVILINFFALGSSRLNACIHAVALQGAVLALLPVTAHGLNGHTLLLSFGIIMCRGGTCARRWVRFAAARVTPASRSRLPS